MFHIVELTKLGGQNFELDLYSENFWRINWIRINFDLFLKRVPTFGQKRLTIFSHPDMTILTTIGSPCRVYSKYDVFYFFLLISVQKNLKNSEKIRLLIGP